MTKLFIMLCAVCVCVRSCSVLGAAAVTTLSSPTKHQLYNLTQTKHRSPHHQHTSQSIVIITKPKYRSPKLN